MRLLSILGPTASGKSAVAIELARALGGEVVSCDSMQLYKTLDVGTAKVTAQERAAIPHHLVDVLELEDAYSVASFIADADVVIRDILARGKQPILCGGTGLYAKALLYGFDCRPTDRKMAQELRREFDEKGAEPLLAELRETAPECAHSIGSNPRHWLRALEIVRVTGQPPHPQDDFHRPDYAAPEFILMPSAQLSRDRIRIRTLTMLGAGWMDETRAVAERLRHSPTAGQAIGYRIILDHLEGRCSRDEMIDRIVTATARYAKRQRTWFRHQHPDGITLTVDEADTPKSIASRILDAWEG